MELLYLSILSAISLLLIFFAFIAGLHYGSKVKHNEVVQIPTPVKAIKRNIENAKIEKEALKEQEIEDINLANIDSYDGTGLGQKDFPE